MKPNTAQRIFYITVIVFLIVIITLNSDTLNNYLEAEYFQNLQKYFLFNNYKSNNNSDCQSRLTNIIHPLSRNTNINKSPTNTKHIDANYIKSSRTSLSTLENLINIDVGVLGYINRLVQIKYGSLTLVPNNNNELELRNIKLDTRGYQSSTFKIVLGLVDPRTVSFYHIATDKYICRNTEGKLFLANFELVDKSVRNTFSFKICQGIVNLDKVIISCPRIYKEMLGRVWCVSKDNLIKYKLNPRMETINNISDSKKCEFTIVDIQNGITLGTQYLGLELNEMTNDSIDRTRQATGIPADDQEPYGLHLPKLFNNSNTTYSNVDFQEGFSSGTQVSKGNKLRDIISALVNSRSGEISREEINELEIFPELASNSLYNTHSHKQKEAFINGDSDASDANKDNDVEAKLNVSDVFGKITGGNAEDILNMDLIGKNYAEILSDNLMERLQEAKLDPNVQSLLDYNEAMYNVYKDENRAYSDKLNSQLEVHKDNVDSRIRQANNFRVNQMARELYNLENILKDKQKK